MKLCTCCGQGRPPVASLRRCPPGEEVDVAALCEDCATWLTGLLRAIIRGQAGMSSLLGLPVAGDRVLVFEGQCALCRALPANGSTGYECRPLQPSFEGWRKVDLCHGCEAWLVSIASDGRSARGNASRAVDGPYGEWPHPNLRFLHVATAVRDDAVRAAISDACAVMGVEVGEPAQVAPGAILMAEVGPGLELPAISSGPFAAAIAVVPIHARAELIEALSAGVTDWLTSPVTPQQVSAALTRVPSRWQQPVIYDPFTALPAMAELPPGRPVLMVEPERGTDLFELAWLLRRHSRGYDDLVSLAGGRVAFLPRVRPEHLAAVASRLELILRGRCQLVEVQGYRGYRLDAAG